MPKLPPEEQLHDDQQSGAPDPTDEDVPTPDLEDMDQDGPAADEPGEAEDVELDPVAVPAGEDEQAGDA